MRKATTVAAEYDAGGLSEGWGTIDEDEGETSGRAAQQVLTLLEADFCLAELRWWWEQQLVFSGR